MKTYYYCPRHIIRVQDTVSGSNTLTGSKRASGTNAQYQGTRNSIKVQHINRVPDTVSGTKAQYQGRKHSIKVEYIVLTSKTQYHGTRHSITVQSTVSGSKTQYQGP